MAIQAKVKYWYNRNMGFGHVAIEVLDMDSEARRYVSWAMRNNPEVDITKHGMPPIEVVLPIINTSFEAFESSLKASPYFLSDEAQIYAAADARIHALCQSQDYAPRNEDWYFINRAIQNGTYNLAELPKDTSIEGKRFILNFIAAINEKNRLMASIPDAIKNELINYGEQYDLINRNCAHCVQDMLYMAGYSDKQPVYSSFLRPYTVAHDSCSIAATQLQNKMKTILMDSLIQEHEKIIKLISLIIDLLENEKKRDSASHFPRLAKNIEADIDLLKNLSSGNFLELESTKKLLQIHSLLNTVVAVNGIMSCLSLVPPQIQYQANVELAIEGLHDNKINFINKNLIQEARATEALVLDLTRNKEDYFSGKINLDDFRANSIKAIERVRPILEKHESSKISLANVLLAIMGLGVLFLVAGAINKTLTGNFFFFNEPINDPLSNVSKVIGSGVKR